MDMHDKILAATSKIISEGGLESVSTREVCKRVGITAPTLYHYFPNKTHLIDAVIYGAYYKYLDSAKSTFYKNSPIKNLLKIWKSYFEFVEKEPEYFNVIILAHAKSTIPPSGYKLYETTLNIFVDAHKNGQLKVSPKIATQTFYSTALGSALLYISQKRNPKIKLAFKESLKLVLKSFFH